MKKSFINKRILMVFVVFFVIILLQNHFLWLFHDDYGYASLSYLTSFKGARGLNTGILDIINFLRLHYNIWGGRVLYFFIEILLLRIDISAYRIFQSIITVLIFYIIYKIIAKKFKFNNWMVAAFCVLCYGVFEINVLRGGIYWITASVLYFIPLLPFLLYVYLYDGKHKKIICAILIFISTWSQEQISALALSYVSLYFIYNYFIEKKRNKTDIIMFIFAILGFAILMLAPGSRVRMGTTSDFYNLSLLGKIMTNVPVILTKNFGQSTKIFSLSFFLTMVYIIYEYRKIGKYTRLADLSIISTIIIILGMIFKSEGYFAYLLYFSDNKIFKILIMILFFIQFLLIFIMVVMYFYKKKDINIIYLIIGALASQMVMIMAPYFPDRSVIMFEIVGFLLMAYCFSDILKNKKINIYYIFIPFVIISLLNFSKILYGYYKNNDEKTYNDKILIDVSKRIKLGEDIKFVNLKKLEDLTYGIEEPYLEDFSYIKIYMKYYYDLPNDIEFIYEED